MPGPNGELHGRVAWVTGSSRGLGRVVAELRERLLAYRDPATGEAVVTAVHRREDMYHGPHASGGPDLLVETGPRCA
jgi:NAD(P)-dependent dehydrogenase (short-subunit alcohol dehydrogenase family)